MADCSFHVLLTAFEHLCVAGSMKEKTIVLSLSAWQHEYRIKELAVRRGTYLQEITVLRTEKCVGTCMYLYCN